MNPSRHRQSGFTLIEIAIVLLIVGLVIGGMIAPLGTLLEQKRVTETRRTMEDAKEALLGFAMSRGYLPCPAISSSNGLEDRIGSTCRKRTGLLPWATLAVPRLDGWNRVLGYTVTPAFSDSLVTFKLGSARDITVKTRDSSGQLIQATGINDVPVAIISFGRNGYGGTSDQNTQIADAGVDNVDEKTNLQSGGILLINRDTADNPLAPGGAFDDMVNWISPNILFNRMVAVQRLP
ncbi:type II secretion system protein [Duganella aceris]|uniref:Type II secretion system protein n=1 Tax=Duganella aceris TaxID=2703883 RepID=A0ABX0FJ50_9BURK|nr:type II secretion system protein [Duganella aceris]NGZ84583.1 type II secretion system protein [Duganella aceris]